MTKRGVRKHHNDLVQETLHKGLITPIPLMTAFSAPAEIQPHDINCHKKYVDESPFHHWPAKSHDEQ